MALNVLPKSSYIQPTAGEVAWGISGMNVNSQLHEDAVLSGNILAQPYGGSGVADWANFAPLGAFGCTPLAGQNATITVSGAGVISLVGPVQPGSPMQFAAGTAALPSITTAGDLNTGAWFPAADTFAVSTAGLEALRVNASQQVILTSVLATTLLQIDNTATDGDPSLSFALSGVTKFTMGVDDGDGDTFKIGTTAIGTGTALTIDGSGNIGVGVSPTTRFEAYESSASQTVLTVSNPDGSGIGSALELKTSSVKGSLSAAWNATDAQWECSMRAAVDYGGFLTFHTFSSSLQERMRITSAGGLYMAGATGGDQGAGTINAVAVYDDSVILTDFVFEPDYHYLSISEMETFLKAEKHLPTIKGKTAWDTDGKFSVGSLSTQLWETVEVQALYIAELHTRLSKLEDAQC